MKNELNKITIKSKSLVRNCPVKEGKYEDLYILPIDRNAFELALIIKRAFELYEHCVLDTRNLNTEVLEELKDLEINIETTNED